MTNSDLIVDYFIFKGYRVTLGEILQHSWGYRFVQRKHDLAKRGIIIDLVFQDFKNASNNVYVLRRTEANGQQAFV